MSIKLDGCRILHDQVETHKIQTCVKFEWVATSKAKILTQLFQHSHDFFFILIYHHHQQRLALTMLGLPLTRI